MHGFVALTMLLFLTLLDRVAALGGPTTTVQLGSIRETAGPVFSNSAHA